MDFPTIQTSFWDGLIAVPVVVILTQIVKMLFHIPKQYVPTTASVFGFIISIFFAHRHDLWAGFFMGGFYGAAAVGTYSGIKTSLTALAEKMEKSR